MNPFKINLDYKQDCYEEIKVSMLDTVKIEATITDNWQTVVLTGATIQMQIGKNDGRYVIQTSNITVVGNKVSITLDEQATVLEGITELTLVINQNSERKGLWIINLRVRRTSITDKVDSITAVPLIQELEDAITEAGVIKVSLENNIPVANTSKTNLVSATTTANTSKTNLDASITTGNTTKTSLDASITTGNALHTNLTSDITTGNTTTTNLNTSVATANTTKTNLDASIVNGDTATMRTDINNNSSQLADMSYLLKQSNIDKTGVIDCTLGVQSFFDAVCSTGGGIIYIPEGTYSFDSSIQYYPDKITLIASKTAIFNFRMTSGYGMLIQPKNPANHWENKKRWISGITFKTSNNIVLVHSEGKKIGSDSYMSSFWSFYNCIFTGGSVGINIWNNTWCTSCIECYFNYNKIAINMDSGGTNYGERISLTGCTLVGSITAIKCYNPVGNIVLNNCSLDYCSTFVEVSNGIVEVAHSYIEGDAIGIDDYWFKIYTAGLLRIHCATMTVMSAKTKEVFCINRTYPTANLYQKGLEIDGLYFYSAFYTLPYLVNGNGRCVFKGFSTTDSSKRPMICKSENKITYGDCNTSAILSELQTISSYTLPTYDSVNKRLNFQASTLGENVGCSLLTECEGNQDSLMHLNLNTSVATNNNRVTIERQYLDKNLNDIIVNKFPYAIRSNFETDYESFTSYYGANFASVSTDISAYGSKSLKCLLSSAPASAGRCNTSFSQIANKYYMIISRVKVASFTSGDIGHTVSHSGTRTQILANRKMTGLTDGWDYVYTYWKALTTDTISVYCAFTQAGGTLTAYIDDIYVYCLSDILPNNTDFTWVTGMTGIPQYAIELMGNKQIISSDVSNTTIRINGSYLYAPQGTKYCRYNIMGNNMNIASSFNVSDICVNSLK